MAALTITVAGFLSILGFVAWFLGFFFDMPAVAIVGAVIIVGVGATAMNDGLQYKDGETRTEVTNSTTEISYTYSQVDSADSFPLGFVIMVLGGLGVLLGLDRYNAA